MNQTSYTHKYKCEGDALGRVWYILTLPEYIYIIRGYFYI